MKLAIVKALLLGLGYLPHAAAAVVVAHGHGRCATRDPPAEEINEDAKKMKRQSKRRTATRTANRSLCIGCIEVSVIFHAIEDAARTSDVSQFATDRDVEEQLRVLNEHFSKTSFRFVLQETVRTVNDDWAFGRTFERDLEHEIPAALRRGGSDVLNVFVTDGTCLDTGGFTSLPFEKGMFPAGTYSKRDYLFLCPFTIASRERRTSAFLTHEVGHWLGLHHTFRGDSCSSDNENDFVDDTPQQASYTEGCPLNGRDSCPNQPYADQIENFMDYTSSECQSLFTVGQVQRMESQFDEYRRRVEPCGGDEAEMRLEIRYDGEPGGIGVGFVDWGEDAGDRHDLKPRDDEGHVDLGHRAASRDFCIPRHSVREVYLTDSEGDGIASPGYYKLRLNGRDLRGPDFDGKRLSLFASGDSHRCPPGRSRLSLDILFDYAPWQIDWEMHDSSSAVVADASKTFFYGAKQYSDHYQNSMLSFDVCLLPGDYEFIIRDEYGDGIVSPGFYSLVMNGKEFERGGGDGGFKSIDSVTFTVSDPTEQTAGQSDTPITVTTANTTAECKDSIGWVDRFNEGCSWYGSNGCDAAQSRENAGGISAQDACCTCGGGNRNIEPGQGCRDYFGFVDGFNGNCGWYEAHGCRGADEWPNSNGVSGNDACCVCGGGGGASPSPVHLPLCFPGSSLVHVLGKGPVRLDRARIGDVVQVGGDRYEPIYSFGHLSVSATASFLRIHMTNRSTALEISAEHMVFTKGNAVPVPASQIVPGDVLLGAGRGEEYSVAFVETVTGRGLFAPFTPSGTIVVDGIVASSYVALWGSSAAALLPPLGVSFQWLAHAFLFPHRVACHYCGPCPREARDADGVSTWAAAPLRLARRSNLLLPPDGQSAPNWPSSGLMGAVVVVLAIFNASEFALQRPWILAVLVVGFLRKRGSARKGANAKNPGRRRTIGTCWKAHRPMS